MKGPGGDTLRRVVQVLDSLGVRHALGGSFASSYHGKARTTMDADLVVDLGLDHAAALARALGDRFYMDVEVARTAIRTRGSFNVISLDTSFKVDLFVLGERPYDRVAFERRRRVDLGDGLACDIVSPEDIILAKLAWFRAGGAVSDLQWGDVLGVLRGQGPRLDRSYLAKWAGALDLWDLLKRATDEAGTPLA